jgi:acyl carrier protein
VAHPTAADTARNRQAFNHAICEFLRTTNPELELDDISETDNLVDLGLVDSLRMVDLIVEVERLLGVEIPVDDLDPRAFHSLRALYDRYA